MRANADTPADAAKARELGAEGIGLCRTEHMFFGDERLPVVQRMILASDEDDRRAALDKLLPFQQSDFEGIFEAMDGLPVTIRLLDPPLHEFLPDRDELLDELARLRAAGRDDGEVARLERIKARVEALHEQNPMLGIRGCRLGLMHPGDLRDAGARDRRAPREAVQGAKVEIMIPLVGYVEELRRLRAMTEAIDRGSRAGDIDVTHRDDDRGAARRADGGRDRGRRPTSSRSAPTTSPR